jgi:predicted secreted Zn-dependent protease
MVEGPNRPTQKQQRPRSNPGPFSFFNRVPLAAASMDARTGSIDIPLKAPTTAAWPYAGSVQKAGWVRPILCLCATLAILTLSKIGQSLLTRPQLSAGDVADRAAGSRADAAAIPELRGIPNVSVSYYEISATDTAGIKAELLESGILWGKRRFRAMTSWNYDWRWDAAPGGGCGTAGARVKFEAKLTLPRHANPDALSPQAARAWNSYMGALIRHEANHVRMAYQGRQLVADAVRSSGCASANAAGELAMAKINYESAKYDEHTHFGWREGARLSVFSK